MADELKPVEILTLAIAVEKESLRRYLELAWQTKDPTGKDIFIRLAMDEYIHRETLEEQITVLNEGREIQPVKLPPSLFEKVLPKLSEKNLRIKGKEYQDRLDALLMALEAERKARDFYYQKAEQIQQGHLRDIFIRLAEMEKAHSDIIQAEIDHIQQTGFWFSFPEFTLEGNP